MIDMTPILITAITIMGSGAAFAFYERRYKTKAKREQQLQHDLKQWRDDLRTRTMSLETKVSELLVENCALKSTIAKLQTTLDRLVNKRKSRVKTNH
jgi:predicted RNase H-like nuclease (RuvC/YqgF family)